MGKVGRGDSAEGDSPLELTATESQDEAPVACPWRELPEGTLVGKYVLEQRYAMGGFGTVYRALHTDSGHVVALKMPRWHLSRSAKFTERFMHEVRAASRIEHPNIVKIHEYGTWQDGRPYYVMEWLAGHTLRQDLRSRGAMSLVEACYVLERIASALTAAHDAGIVHRDLKSSNVMLVPEADSFQVKLLDFGLAKLFDMDTGASIHLTATGEVLGTPQVMAPEQICGGRIGPPTDVYAFGVMIYQLLTGDYPFDASSFAEIRQMHLSQPPPRVSEHSPVPAVLDPVIARCMAKAPGDRFATIAQAMNAVHQVSAGGDLTRFETPTSQAVGVHFQVVVTGNQEGDDDATLDAIEQMLDTALDTMAAASLDIALETSRGFLAVAVLSPDEPTARAQRQQVLQQVLKLAIMLEQTIPTGIAVHPEFTVHRGTLTVSNDNGDAAYIDGELLQLDEWTIHHCDARVVATEPALAGIDNGMDLQPVAGRIDCRKLR